LIEILDAGVPLISNQVQYSALDRRPEGGMAGLCKQYGLSLLCYGTVAGGFLSGRYLRVPEPLPPFENRSLTKYKLIIDEFGGWAPFQALLEVLSGIAARHDTSIAAVATRYVLQKPQAGAAIVGARHARHLPDTLRFFDFALEEEDLADINHIVDGAQGPRGDVYELERVKGGVHAAVMKYDLNEE
jgi:aryl-alcohol dehydrogenase-like predicted oxidoreductase